MVTFYTEKIKEGIEACREPHHFRQLLRFYRQHIIERNLIDYFRLKLTEAMEKTFSKNEKECFEDVLLDVEIMLDDRDGLTPKRISMVEKFEPLTEDFDCFSMEIDYSKYKGNNLGYEVMQALYVRTFNYYNGNKKKTAQILGISVRSLSDNLKKIGG